MNNEIEIPFGAFDSELMHQEIFIPEGFEATIEGNRIILTRKESEDEQHRKWILDYLYDGLRKSDEQFKSEFKCAIAWFEKQGKQKETNLVEILKYYPKETELYSPLYGRLWLAEVDEKNEIIICYKHHLEEGCTRAILEQEDTVSFYSNGTTGLPDFNISKDCMLFLYDIEKQGKQKLPIEKLPSEIKTIGESLGFTTQKECDNYNKMVIDLIMSDDNKVEPKFKVKYAGSEYNVFETKNIAGVTFYGIEDEPNHIDYVKADNCEIISGYGIKESGLSIPTKPVMFSEKKPQRIISAEAKEAMYDKPADKVELKFKVGDWVVSPNGVYWHIDKISNNRYEVTSNTGESSDWSLDTNIYHKFTIQDAKDGDVLFMDNGSANCIFIYKSSNNGIINKYASCNNFGFEGEHYLVLNDGYVIPVTKEQRNNLFQKMKEAGYEWDAEKKELKKIEQKSTQETEPFEAEHGKYYYCIKDYFWGGRKQASKGDIIQALRGLPIMGLKDASEYFLPVNSIKCNHAWSEEDEKIYGRIYDIVHSAAYSNYEVDEDGEECGEYAKMTKLLKSLKQRIGG